MFDDIQVVLDSVSSVLDTEWKDDPRIDVLRLVTRHGDLEWRDGDKSEDELFEMIEKTGVLPKTSQPSIGEMIELLTRLTDAGKKVIMLMCDSTLSGTYATACMAAKDVNKARKSNDVRVVDCKTCSVPIVGIAKCVLEEIEKGTTIDEVEAYANDCVDRTETYFTVDTLEYLHKGGRIGKIGVLFGNIFGIRPIIHTDENGVLEVADKCRSRKKSLKRIIELSCACAPIEEIYVANGGCQEDADNLLNQMKEQFPGVPFMQSKIGSVLAAHLGPGCIGCFVRRRKS
ncbi:MAG: DegV family protein [Phascolarctobacterium sp.]|nr:DegV family protein [Phascolarctobacterium sp.]